MSLNFKARDWHNWTSVILAVPLILVGLSAIFIAHKKEWKLNDIDLSAAVSWLPGYAVGSADHSEYAEIRTSLIDRAGGQWAGTQSGLYRIAAGRAEPIAELQGVPVRDLVQAPWGLVAAAKSGVWRETAGGWQRVLAGDAWNANLNADGSVVVALKEIGAMTSRDGLNWHKLEKAVESLARIPAEERAREKISLGKLMLDLHTGKAFFGKNREWIWIDLTGAILALLGFTGMYMWWRSQTKRRDAARGKLPRMPADG